MELGVGGPPSLAHHTSGAMTRLRLTLASSALGIKIKMGSRGSESGASSKLWPLIATLIGGESSFGVSTLLLLLLQTGQPRLVKAMKPNVPRPFKPSLAKGLREDSVCLPSSFFAHPPPGENALGVDPAGEKLLVCRFTANACEFEKWISTSKMGCAKVSDPTQTFELKGEEDYSSCPVER